MRKIEISKIEDMICIEGQKCPFCGDKIVRGHYNRPFFCTKTKKELQQIEDRITIEIDIDNTLDMTPIFEEYFNKELMFEIRTRIENQDEYIATITFNDEVIWNIDMLD